MNDKAISPVIGVILFAITVILAAVITVFVFEASERLNPNPPTYEVTATVTQKFSNSDGYFLELTRYDETGSMIRTVATIQWDKTAMFDLIEVRQSYIFTLKPMGQMPIITGARYI